MPITTHIEYCDSTLNLQMGCDGCELWTNDVRKCYAGILHSRHAGTSSGYPASFDRPKIFQKRLLELQKWPDLTGTERKDKPWLNGLPRIVFLNDMGDTFTESLPLDWLAEPLMVCPSREHHESPRVQHLKDKGVCVCTACAKQWKAEPIIHLLARTPHIYLLLTKRAHRMMEFSRQHPFPPNFWCGASVTSKANEARIDYLLQTRCSRRWISAEPLLGPLEIGLAGTLPKTISPMYSAVYEHIHWVVAGGESGPGARAMNLEWTRSLIRECELTRTPMFVKQLGRTPYYITDRGSGRKYDLRDPQQKTAAVEELGRILDSARQYRLRDAKGGDPSEWPIDMRVRQMPE